ncbi:unnamed protein product [Nezara viridula]|uniref:Intraflagellar transport protein 22 homolog n=1 Tax=Nezara viridula TaxID=85310 RepID=A0A9P0MV63_NEZVI|nr:unnamed protein product [Nezara viridula]
MIKLKIVLIGPSKSGKSTIANFLSEAIDYTNTEYRPTPGVRILEFELKNNESSQTEIELWDCSGEMRYESYWPVFLWNAHGVILIYNPEDMEQSSQLEKYYEQFVTNSYVPKKNTLIMAHTKKTGFKASMPDFGDEMSKTTYERVNIFEDSDKLRNVFENYISMVVTDAVDFDQDDLSHFSMSL